MNANKFGRQRAIIEHAKAGRSRAWRKRALAKLAADTGVEQIATGKRIIAYRLPDGRVICVKHRYQNEAAAIDAIQQIARTTGSNKKPIRAYPCYQCMGWHITSEQR